MLAYYAVYFLFSLILCLVFYLLIKYTEFKTNRYIQNIESLYNLQLSALKQERAYNINFMSGALNEYPNIKEYIAQSSTILDNFYRLDAELKCVCLIPSNNSKEIYEEYINCDDEEVKKMLYRQIAIANRMYRIKYPFKYKINEFKKNSKLHILRLIIRLAIKMHKNGDVEKLEKDIDESKYTSNRIQIGITTC